MSRLTPMDRKHMVQLHMHHLNSALSHLAALGPKDGMAVCHAIMTRERNPFEEESLGNWMDSLEKLRPRLVLKMPQKDLPQPQPQEDTQKIEPKPEPTLFDFVPCSDADTAIATAPAQGSGDFDFGGPPTFEPEKKQTLETPQPYAEVSLPPPPLQTQNDCAEQLGCMWQSHLQHAPPKYEFMSNVPPYTRLTAASHPWSGVIQYPQPPS
jgi:hypothetical protein